MNTMLDLPSAAPELVSGWCAVAGYGNPVVFCPFLLCFNKSSTFSSALNGDGAKKAAVVGNRSASCAYSVTAAAFGA